VYVVDTNVLVYAADRDSPYHGESLDLVQRLRLDSAAWYLTWNVIYEFVRVVTHPKVMRRPWTIDRAWAFVDALLASPSAAVPRADRSDGHLTRRPRRSVAGNPSGAASNSG
jgi:predicted nucleic acid-binding protein